jgi:hypothetical protein
MATGRCLSRSFVNSSTLLAATRAAVYAQRLWCAVLNTRDMMFIDVDRDETAPPIQLRSRCKLSPIC